MISIDEKWILGEIVGHFDGGASWTADREALILDTESGSVLLSVDSNGQGRYMVRFGDAGRGDLPGLDIELGDASTMIEAREMLDERLPEGLAQLVTNLEEDVAERKGLANALAPFSGSLGDFTPLGPPQDGDILTVVGATAYMLLHLADITPVALGTLIAPLPEGAVRLFVHGSSTPPAADIVHPDGRRTCEVKAPPKYYGAVLGAVTVELSSAGGQTWAQVLEVERFAEPFAVNRETLGCWASPPALAEKLRTKS